MDKKIKQLKNIKYFDGKEYKFDDYKDVLIKLSEYTPENIKNMYKPFVKKGKYRGQTVNKIVALTRGVLDNEEWEEMVFSYKENKEYLVYNAVAKTFNRVEELEKINYQGYEIHHINNNGYENTPENLIWLTKKQHNIVHGKK